MTATQISILAIYATIVAIWPIRLVVLSVILRNQPFLTPQSPELDSSQGPTVTAILPAKDEEIYIGECLESIRAQTYRNLDMIVVDDRSTDRTGEIARAIAATDSRTRVLTITDLPEGWTGKTHALVRTSGLATGEWLLFVDADTLHTPESLAIMMRYARDQGASLVSLLPELRCETFWERIMQPLAAITLMQSFPLGGVNNDRSPLAFANGQYILVKRTAYDAAGGHTAVRHRFVEDIALAQRIKGRGLPIRVAIVRGIVTCRMYASYSQVVRGWSRILYDALERKPSRLILKLLDPLIFCQSGHLALIASVLLLACGRRDAFTIIMLFLSMTHHFLMYLVFRLVYRASGVAARWVAWFPVANLVIDLILVRTLRMCITGAVTWRGTQYTSVARRDEPAST